MATRNKPAKDAQPAVQAPADEVEQPAEVVVAVKGFDANWQCRGYQYALGQTYEHAGPVAACSSGFHACENPIDVFAYYAPGESRFALVEVSGSLSRHSEDSKIAAANITIKAELTIPKIVEMAIAWITAKCDKSKAAHSTGLQSASSSTRDRSASSSTGDRSASSSTGLQSASSSTGDQSASSSTGYRSASSSTGERSASSSTGYRSASSSTGHQSASSSTGDQSASSSTGYRSASSSTGYRSASSSTGDRSASSSTGDRSASSSTGERSASSSTGDQSASSSTGIAAVALNAGRYGKARASKGGAIVICNHDDDGNLRHIFASKVGENGIKPDVFYTLGDDGAPVEGAQ